MQVLEQFNNEKYIFQIIIMIVQSFTERSNFKTFNCKSEKFSSLIKTKYEKIR